MVNVLKSGLLLIIHVHFVRSIQNEDNQLITSLLLLNIHMQSKDNQLDTQVQNESQLNNHDNNDSNDNTDDIDDDSVDHSMMTCWNFSL